MRIKFRPSFYPVLIIFFAASLILGYLITGQYFLSSSKGALRNLTQEQLSSLYTQQARELAGTQLEVLNLRSRLNDFEQKRQSRKQILESIRKEIKLLEGALGLAPVRGPGVKILVSVEKNILKSSELYDLLNELKASGSQAISVNGNRVHQRSYFVVRGSRYYFDGKEISPPFEFKAIGDPETLYGALTMSGGIINNLESIKNVTLVVSKEEQMTLPAREKITFQYASPVE